ncbi:MAG: hypothetical protein AAF193_06720, partial [Bacteroidota bacterium]
MYSVKAIFISALAVLLGLFAAQAQSFNDEKSSSLNSFFGFEGLRPNNPGDIYEVQFVKDSTYFYTKEDGDDDFTLNRKLEFAYDNQGGILEESEFLRLEDGWLPQKLNNFRFSSDGVLQYKIVKSWSAVMEDFVNSERRFYTANIFGSIETEVVELYVSETWQSYWRYDFQYNLSNEVTEELKSRWNNDELVWSPSQKIIYTYNELNSLTSQLIQIWLEDSQAWENSSYQGYEYNEFNQLINLSENVWNSSFDDWEEQAFQSLTYTALGQVENSSTFDSRNSEEGAKETLEATYDENGNLNTTLLKEWDSNLDIWNTLEKQVHFWSE